MTAREAIERVDTLKYNQFTTREKLGWLQNLEWQIKAEIIDGHEDDFMENPAFLSEDTMDADLLAIPPYDDMYLKWLEAQIDYHNGEFDRYNNSIALFQTAFDGYKNFYHRHHMPLGKKIRYF